MLPWVEVARASRGFGVVSAGQMGSRGFHRNQNGRMGIVVRVILTLSKNGDFSKENRLDAKSVLVLGYEERSKSWGF